MGYAEGTVDPGWGGGCGNCGHDYIKQGCWCFAAWCPCHRARTGHGAWDCDCTDKALARLENIKKVSRQR